MTADEKAQLLQQHPEASRLVRRLYGSRDYLNGELRYCLWIDDASVALANSIPEIRSRIERVRESRVSGGQVARGLASRPHQFRYTHQATTQLIITPRVSSDRRPYIPFGLLPADCIVSDAGQAIYDGKLWNLAVLLTRMHMVWVRAISGRLKTDPRYSSALSYNTFPLLALTDKNRADLGRSAEDILIAREHHFPSTLSELYDPETMPGDLRQAHDHNDEVLERIYIGRRFKNDTERLEKLFDLYTKMTAATGPATTRRPRARAGA